MAVADPDAICRCCGAPLWLLALTKSGPLWADADGSATCLLAPGGRHLPAPSGRPKAVAAAAGRCDRRQLGRGCRAWWRRIPTFRAKVASLAGVLVIMAGAVAAGPAIAGLSGWQRTAATVAVAFLIAGAGLLARAGVIHLLAGWQRLRAQRHYGGHD
jgi:hypothetical protein